MSRASEMADASAKVVKTDTQARALVEALGANPARIAWNARLDLTLFAIADECVKQGWSTGRFHAALSKVAAGTAAGPELVSRVRAFLAVWPSDSRLPDCDRIASIVGGTSIQVSDVLANGDR
jgi:hypothetical protein